MKNIFKLIAKKNIIKPQLEKILYKNGKFVATDTFALLEVGIKALPEDTKNIGINLQAELLASKLHESMIPMDIFKLDNNTLKDLDLKSISTEDFPAYEQVMPADKDIENEALYTAIKLDAGRLEDLLHSIKLCYGKTNKVTPEIKMYIPRMESKPLLITAKENRIKGLLMPMAN